MGTELTNLFLTFRDRLGKTNTSLIAKVNSALFFVSYTILRMILMPTIFIHLCIRLFRALVYGNPQLLWKICYPTAIVFFGGIVGLNFFWYSIILRGAKALFLGGGKTSGKKSD